MEVGFHLLIADPAKTHLVIFKDELIDVRSQFLFVWNLTFGNIKINAPTVIGNCAAGYRKWHAGAKQVHHGVGPHIAVTRVPIEIQFDGRSQGWKMFRICRYMHHILCFVINRSGDLD